MPIIMKKDPRVRASCWARTDQWIAADELALGTLVELT